MKNVTDEIPGYRYGAADASRSPISLQDLERLKTSAGFTEEDERYLQLAGKVLSVSGGRSDSRLPGEEQSPL
jgi:hypothetical protein